MRILKNDDLEVFEYIVSLSQKELIKVMEKYLKKKYSTVIMTDKYLYAEGNIPIALAAHLDTVFPRQPDEVYYDPKHGVMWSPQGLGADDRAGVFAIVNILKDNLRPHVLLLTDEEMGCIGADALAKKKMPFKELKYIIELDRQGHDDCVFYDCFNPKFTEYIQSFGFCEEWGTYSDISSLCPAWNVCGVNLSIGYENEHSVSEILHVDAMFNTINKVKQMLKEENIPDFEYRQVAHNYLYYLNKMNGREACGGVVCGHCGNFFNEYDTYPVSSVNGIEHYCLDCIVDEVEWCEKCGEPFAIYDDPSATLCHRCRDKAVEVIKVGAN